MNRPTATATFRGTVLVPIAQAAGALGDLRASTYVAYRAALGDAGANLPARFTDLVVAAADFVDPVIIGLDSGAIWNPVIRRWQQPAP